MGIEYRIRCAPGAADMLRRLSGWHAVADRFDHGPDASAWADADGILFCDHLGADGRRLLGELVAALAGYGPVTVEEL